MNEIPTEEIYEKVWKPLLEPKNDGEIDREVMQTLLFDYGATLHNLSILYPYITNGHVTDPQAPIDEIMAASDKYIADTLDGEIEKILHYLLEQDDPAAAATILLESGQAIEEASD